jgi:biotin carboxylase
MVAKAANQAVGITNGPSHTEIIVTEGGSKVVELGARLGGDFITTHLVPLSTGVNMVECCIRIALGEIPDVKQKFSKGSAIRYFPQKIGILKKILGVENARKLEGIQQISFVKDVGTKVTEIYNSGSRIGFVIAQATNANDAILACEEAMNQIQIEIE